MSQFNRCVLAHALLDGDWDARWILADLLCEEGDEELAAFARNARRMTSDGDLDLAIRLLPFGEAISMGCAMLDRGMTGRGMVRRHAWLLARLSRIRRLVRSAAPVEQLAVEGQSLVNYQVAATPGRSDHALEDAARSLGAALEQADAASAAGIAVAALARSMRTHRRGHYHEELQWQIDRTQQVLEKLIEATAQEPYALP